MTDEKIIKLYQQGESALTIQKKYGVNYKKVYRILEGKGIKRRTHKEKTINAIKQNRGSNSELQKKIASERWKGKNNPRYGLEKSNCEICGKIAQGRINRTGKMLCSKHYTQMRNNGYIFERTRFDKNKIIDKNNYFELEIYNKKQKIIGHVKIDREDLEKIKKHKWCLCNKYVSTAIKGKMLKLHQLILDKKEGMDIDHINHDKLDNRKQNLRYCTRSQNLMNMSNVKGITWDKHRNKWVAQLQINYKHIYLGRFEKEEDAMKARINAEKKYFGEFAPKRT